MGLASRLRCRGTMSGTLRNDLVRANLAEALAAELPEVEPGRLRAALERAVARVLPLEPSQVAAELAGGADPAALTELIDEAEAVFRDTAQWEHLVDLHVARVGASSDAAERSAILMELAVLLEDEMNDRDRALAARLAAFGERPDPAALPELGRLAAATGTWDELALRLGDVTRRGDLDDATTAAASILLSTIYRHHFDDPDSALATLERAAAAVPHSAELSRALADAYTRARRLPDALDQLGRMVCWVDSDEHRAALYREMAAGWEQLGRLDRAAECFEWVLSFAPGDDQAYEQLTRLYRATSHWRALIETLGRRATDLEPSERAPVFLDIASIYEDELGDESSATDFYQTVNELDPGRPDVLAALIRLYRARGAHDEALATVDALVAVVPTPYRKAAALVSAAEIAWADLRDGDTARDLLRRARATDPDCRAAVVALAGLHRERGELVAAVEVLEDAAARPVFVDDRGPMYAEAGELALAGGDLDRAEALLFEARAAAPGELRVTELLVEILWRKQRFDEVVPLLEERCAELAEGETLRDELVRLGHAARATGRPDLAREALARAVELDPRHRAARRALGDLLFELASWADARDVLAAVLDAEEDTLPTAACVELHYRVGRCAHQLGDKLDARRHTETALALDPEHRPSLELHAELDAGDPAALVTDRLALANAAPPEERAGLLAAIGDFYAESLGDTVSAQAMYREALLCRPTDHLLLTRCLGITAEDGDWSRCLDLVLRLVDSEDVPSIRARYRRAAAMICRDELDDPEEAATLLAAALEDAPELIEVADELEALLVRGGNGAELARFYYLRLDHLRAGEVREGETLRIWDRLGEVCVALGWRADAVCAYEVTSELDPDSVTRRHRLADLYLEAGADQRDKAIAQHQAILRGNKRRLASYEALRSLYHDTGRPAKADACADALAVIGMRPVEVRHRAPTPWPLGLETDAPALRPEDYQTLSMGEIDRMLSALFAGVAPVFALDRPRRRLARRAELDPDDGRLAMRALRHVAARLGVDAPVAYHEPEQAATALLALRQGRDRLVPALTLGRAGAASEADPRELVFELGRSLVDLRGDRFARLLCPRADELGQIVEFAVALGRCGDVAAVAEQGHTSRWLATSLRPVDLDQVMIIGQRLAERDVDPVRAALRWLEATDRVGDRVGYLLAGHLGACVRVLEREPTARSNKHERILDLVWSSVTEAMFEVRERLEQWSADAASDDANHVA